MAGLDPFTDDHQAFRRIVRDFCEKELAPHAREWDAAAEFPRALFRTFGEMMIPRLSADTTASVTISATA